MRIASLLLVLPFVLFSSWAFRPMPDEQPVPAVHPRLVPEPVANDQPVLSAMPRIEDEKRPARFVTLRAEAPTPAYVGNPCTLTLHLKNVSTKALTNLLLTASFDKGLEHETKARPVVLNIPELKAGESKTFPLILTPAAAAEFGVQFLLTGDDGVQADAQAKVKATAPSVSQAPDTDNTLVVRSLVFGQAQSRSGGICVSYLATHYELCTWISPDAKNHTGHYYAPVTAEVKNDYPADQIRALTVSGTRLDSKELAISLKEKSTVLIFWEREAIDPLILALFKPDTLILVLPAPPAPPVVQNAEVTPTQVSAETPAKKTETKAKAGDVVRP